MLSQREHVQRTLAAATVQLKPREVTYTWVTGFGLRIIAVSTALGSVHVQAWGEKLDACGNILHFPVWLSLEEIEIYVQDGLARLSPNDTGIVPVSNK